MSHSDALIFIPALVPGGAERATISIANGLSGAGVSVALVTLDQPGELERELSGAVTRHTLPALSLIKCVAPLRRLIHTTRPRAVIGATYGPNIALWAARFGMNGAPRLVCREANTPSAALERRGSTQARAIRTAIAFVYARADRVICVSEGVRDDLAGLGVPQSRMAVAYNPFDFDALAARAQEPLPDVSDFDPAKPFVVGAGRFVPAKDFALFLDACARAQGDFQIVLLGEGPEREALRAQAERLGLGARLVMPGFVANPYAWFARASAYLLTSHFEGMPNVLVQALCLGCPVVTVDCPSGPAELARLVPLGVSLETTRDPEKLGARLSAMLEKPRPDAAAFRANLAPFEKSAAIARYRRLLLDDAL